MRGHRRTLFLRGLSSATIALVGLALVATTLATTLATGPAVADGSGTATPTASTDPAAVARDALARAESFTRGDLRPLAATPRRTSLLSRWLHPTESRASQETQDTTVDGTLVLRDLFRVSADLTGDDQKRAQQILARPTDKGRDTYGDGYTVGAQVTCTQLLCIHYVPTTADAPPSKAWVAKVKHVMTRVWHTEVDRLGYRRPLTDGNKGGDGRFDVYLKDLGNTGAYGYCTPEKSATGTRFTSAGYCVLDNDFSPKQFAGVAATRSLRVTAAHEFFHAIQFAYDFGEDPWFMESTAVWMEERAAGGINDNRQYLPYGQLESPGSPLDHFQASGFSQYGNWPWWEYLSQRFGVSIVRKVWKAAAAGAGTQDLYSIAATRSVLAGRGGLPAVFAAYAAATTDAAHAYKEGRSWPAARSAGGQSITADAPRVRTTASIDHLASSSYLYRPDPATVQSASWSLKVVARLPQAATSPAVAVRITKVSGAVVDRTVPVTPSGYARTVVPFGATGIAQVTVTMANVSTRYQCWRGSFAYSCQGKPLDNNEPFTLTVKAFRR